MLQYCVHTPRALLSVRYTLYMCILCMHAATAVACDLRYSTFYDKNGRVRARNGYSTTLVGTDDDFMMSLRRAAVELLHYGERQRYFSALRFLFLINYKRIIQTERYL